VGRYIFLLVVRVLSEWIFVAAIVVRCRDVCRSNETFSSLFQPSARFYSLQRELPLRHLQDDLLLATAFVSELKFILLFNFLIQSHSHL